MNNKVIIKISNDKEMTIDAYKSVLNRVEALETSPVELTENPTYTVLTGAKERIVYAFNVEVTTTTTDTSTINTYVFTYLGEATNVEGLPEVEETEPEEPEEPEDQEEE